MDNSNTKGGRGEATRLVFVHGTVTEHLSREEFEMLLVHHLEHRIEQARDIHTTRYSVPDGDNRFVFVSNDDATTVAVAFEDDVRRLLVHLIGPARMH